MKSTGQPTNQTAIRSANELTDEPGPPAPPAHRVEEEDLCRHPVLVQHHAGRVVVQQGLQPPAAPLVQLLGGRVPVQVAAMGEDACRTSRAGWGGAKQGEEGRHSAAQCTAGECRAGGCAGRCVQDKQDKQGGVGRGGLGRGRAEHGKGRVTLGSAVHGRCMQGRRVPQQVHAGQEVSRCA